MSYAAPIYTLARCLALLSVLAACSINQSPVSAIVDRPLDLALENTSTIVLSDITLAVTYKDHRVRYVSGIDQLQPNERRTLVFTLADDVLVARIDYTGVAGAKHQLVSKAALFSGAVLVDKNTVKITDNDSLVQFNNLQSQAQFYDPDGDRMTRIMSTTDEHGVVRSYTYDASGNLTTEVPLSFTPAAQ